MRTVWMPIIKEILLLLLAVWIFLVLYDCLVKKEEFRFAMFKWVLLLGIHPVQILFFVADLFLLFWVYTLVFE